MGQIFAKWFLKYVNVRQKDADFLSCIVTIDESWVDLYKPETKEEQ